METVESCSRQEQAVCEQLVRESPRIGPALCSLYDVYRGSGITREDALAMTLKQVTNLHLSHKEG
jgi:hypothetical protein